MLIIKIIIENEIVKVLEHNLYYLMDYVSIGMIAEQKKPAEAGFLLRGNMF